MEESIQQLKEDGEKQLNDGRSFVKEISENMRRLTAENKRLEESLKKKTQECEDLRKELEALTLKLPASPPKSPVRDMVEIRDREYKCKRKPSPTSEDRSTKTPHSSPTPHSL